MGKYGDVFYLCDGEVPECKKRICFKNGGMCKWTTDIKHAVNFWKPSANSKYREKTDVKRPPVHDDTDGR
jgi:hypothetical protein